MAESCPGTTKSSLDGIRPGTSGMKPIQLRWPSWSMPRKKKPSGGILGAMEQRHRLMDRTFGWGVTGVMLVRSILNTVRIQACRFIRIFRTNTARFLHPKLSAACGIQHTYLMVCCTTKLIWKLQSIYTDTAGFTEHVFALMHLLGFAFAPRIRDLHDKRLFYSWKAELYQGLQSIISTTSLNLKEIETHWHEVLRLASSIKQGTVNSITDDEKAGKLSEAEWSGQGAERDWPHRKVIVYAGLVQGSFTASTRTGGAE